MKILIAIHGAHPDTTAINFACYLANLSKSKLTGIFLQNSDYVEPTAFRPVSQIFTPPANKESKAVYEKSIERFSNACIARGTGFKIHNDTGLAVHELIMESRFADVLIIDSAMSFTKENEKTPSNFVKKILHESECPVIIAPESDREINDILLTYDGKKSSVYAMKQFTYLFPQFQNNRVTAIEISESLPAFVEKYRIHEWLKEHYHNIHFSVHPGDEQSQLLINILEKENSFVIMGAYGRGIMSSIFKDSHATSLIKIISQPLFIAHC